MLEHERGKFYDTVIQYPTTLLVIFIGGAFYSFNNYFDTGYISDEYSRQPAIIASDLIDSLTQAFLQFD